MRLRLWHKLILIICVLSVLLFSFSLNIGAVSSVYVPNISTDYFVPIFSPISISFIDPDHVDTLDLISYIQIPDSDYSSDLAIVTEIVEDNDVNTTIQSTITHGVPSYSYSSSYGTIVNVDSSYGSDFYNNADSLVLRFTDFYFDTPSYSSTISDLILIDLGYFDFAQSIYDNVSISSQVLYLNNDSLTSTYVSIPCNSIPHGLRQLSSYAYSTYPNGCLLTNIKVEADFTRRLSSLGPVLFDVVASYCEPIHDLGAVRALSEWSDEFGDTIITENPTILESIQVGLDAVWNTSLFGLFTIGTVFSACAGVALFAWLLKIFNR